MRIRFIIIILLWSQLMTGQDTARKESTYKDGTYTGQSRSRYTAEPFWGNLAITVENGKFTGVRFTIRDSLLHETFNDGYAKHFAGNEMYIQQTRNDWKGVNTYPGILLRKQKIGKADVITGATWSYNIFKASLEDALKKAK